MLTAKEAASSLYGAYRLARLDPGGLAYFDTSVGGFWRSFSAAVFVAPLYAALLAIRYDAGLVDAPPGRYAALEFLFYVISWVLYPVLMATVTNFLDRRDRFIGYIVAYNWAAVWQNLVYLPLAMLTVSGVLSPQFGSLLGLVILGLILAYLWVIARAALDVPAFTAGGLVAFDLLLSIVVSQTLDGVL